jgi:hypothetical protein
MAGFDCGELPLHPGIHSICIICVLKIMKCIMKNGRLQDDFMHIR